MIKTRFKKITKLTILIAARQGWKLLCNVYHLVNQPFLTLKELKRTKDKSQIFLISVSAIFPIIFYITARIFWDHYRYGGVIVGAGSIFKIILLIETVIFGYLGYWIFRMIKK